MIKAVEWTDEGIKMLEQRLLPNEEKYLMLHTYMEVADSIRDMVVRGAPAIGISAAYGAALGAKQFVGTSMADFEEEFDYVCEVLGKTLADRSESFLGARTYENDVPKSESRRKVGQRNKTDPAGRRQSDL